MKEDFEVQLRRALQRQDPSPGFAERVIARTRAPQRSSWRIGAGRIWVGSAVAAMLVAAPLLYQRQQQQRAEEAREQVILALQITAEKLNVLQERMQDLDGKESRKP